MPLISLRELASVGFDEGPGSEDPPAPVATTEQEVAQWADILTRAPLDSVVTDAELRAGILSTGLPWRVRERVTGMVMHLVPPGEFQMGSPADEPGRDRDEYLHPVRLTTPYYVAITELTYGTWRDVCFRDRERDPSWSRSNDAEAIRLTYWETREFLRDADAGLRLLTEAEWEYACRAGTTTAYYTGAELTQGEASFRGPDESILDAQTLPRLPRQFPANALGLFDMAGNVAEWCSDLYGEDAYIESPLVDPRGPTSGLFGVVRGGSRDSDVAQLRSASRVERGSHGAPLPFTASPALSRNALRLAFGGEDSAPLTMEERMEYYRIQGLRNGTAGVRLGRTP